MDRFEKLFHLAVAASLLIVFLPRHTFGQQRLEEWSGFVHESRVPLLEGPHSPIELPPEERQLDGLGQPPWPILYGLLTRQEE